MDKQIKRYYKERHHGGKNTAARFMDGLALRLIAALACYLWYQSNVRNQVLALALTGLTFLLMLIALGLYRGLAFDKFVIKEKARLNDALLLEKLRLARSDEYEVLCDAIAKKLPNYENAYVAHIKKASSVTEDDILRVYHEARDKGFEAMIICSLSAYSSKAAAFAPRLPIAATLIKPEEILDEARGIERFEISPEEADAYILAERDARSRRKRGMQTNTFFAGCAKRYIIAALILIAASFITRYALYYRMLSALCAGLGGCVFILNRGKQAESDTNF